MAVNCKKCGYIKADNLNELLNFDAEDGSTCFVRKKYPTAPWQKGCEAWRLDAIQQRIIEEIVTTPKLPTSLTAA